MIESKYLKDNIQNIQKLMNIQTLKHFEARSLGKLLKLSKIREYDDGEEIIKEGGRDPWFYILLSGKIKIVKNRVAIGLIDSVGEIFGEMRIIDDKSRSASVFSVGKTMCLAIDTSAPGDNEEDDRDQRLDFLLLLYRIFAEFISIRLRLTNEKLVQTKKTLNKLTQDL